MSGSEAPSPEVDEQRFWALHRLALAASETPRTAEGVRRIEAATKALQEPAEAVPRAPKPETTEGPMLPRAPRSRLG